MTASNSRHRAGTTVLAPSGELDIVTVPQLHARLQAAHAPGVTVVLDLQEVTFMDSSALAVLLAADRRLRCAGGVLRLTNVAEPVLRVLRICGLAERLTRSVLTCVPTGSAVPAEV